MAEDDDDGASETVFQSLFALELREARRRLLDAFDRAYLQNVLDRVHGNVAAAARAADVDRGTLFRMLRRLGLHVERRGATRVTHEFDASSPRPRSRNVVDE
ncbi:MAG: helix-turn-helix domain-containing protein [Polyangiales bacterium]